jgi:hypothetical protein
MKSSVDGIGCRQTVHEQGIVYKQVSTEPKGKASLRVPGQRSLEEQKRHMDAIDGCVESWESAKVWAHLRQSILCGLVLLCLVNAIPPLYCSEKNDGSGNDCVSRRWKQSHIEIHHHRRS